MRLRGIALLPALVALLAVAAPAAAQDGVRVRAQVDRFEMSEGEDLRLLVEVVGQGLERVGPPDMNDLGDYEVSGGPSVSTRYQWVNGVSTSAKTWTYSLTPKKTGRTSVPPLVLLVNGRTYRTESIDVTVIPQGSIPHPNRPAPRRPAPGTFGGTPDEPAQQRRQPAPAALRLRAEVDDRSVYVGQQVTVKVVLDTQAEVLNAGPAENPSFPGFWAEEIPLPDRTEVRRVVIDGEPWNEITLMKRALFPTTAGTLTIPPVAWQVQIRRRSSDPLESFFFTPVETVTRRSDPITVTALPLPSAGRPAGFSGAVGKFDLSVVADRQSARVSDALGLKIKVSGEGSLNAAGEPTIADLPDFKRFDPKVTATTSVQADRLRAEKVWDYVVIPLAPGNQTLPAITFSYFDPSAKEYRTASSKPVAIRVDRGDPAAAGGAPVVGQSDVRVVGRDIRHLKQSDGGLEDRSRPFYRSAVFFAMLLLPLAADAALWGFARTRDDSPLAARSRRERRARGVARRRLKVAHRSLSKSTAQAFYAAVAQAMTDYIGDKFGTAGIGLTHPRIEELLVAGGASDELRAAFHRTLEACDFARFAPSSSDEAEMRRVLEAAEECLAGLERSIAR
ncbi:MAG TPA: BatD family protein [Dongiaceae bacterium]|nr:BatD family protein [Dongiaceae bacterium]